MPGALEGRGAIKEFSVFQAVTLATSGGSIPDASCHLHFILETLAGLSPNIKDLSQNHLRF